MSRAMPQAIPDRDRGTNMSNDQTLPLSAEQLAVIQGLGSQGYYAAMYKYIADQMSAGLIPGYSQDQLYWFREAAAVNANEESSPAAFFIRDMTRLGMGLSSTSDPEIQAVSNALGQEIFNQINADSAVPDFTTQLNDDISVSLKNAGLTIGEWGGSFYFWNAAYIDPATNAQTTVGQYILSNSSDKSEFVTNVAQAIADTMQNFSPSLDNDSTVIQAFRKGLSNLVLGGVQSAIVGYEILNQVLLDMPEAAVAPLLQMLEGGGTGNGLYAAVGSAGLTAGNGTNALFGGQELGGVGNDLLVGGSGSDTFVFALPASAAATETISDKTGNGQIAVLDAAGDMSFLGGTAAQPLAAVIGHTDAWTDNQGTMYAFDPTSGDLTITNGLLGSGNEVVIDDFDVDAATETIAQGGSADGYLGFHLADGIALTAGATTGFDPPPPDFSAGSTQSYTVSVDAASTSAQAVTITLSGAPASDFGLLSGSSVIPISSDGTFTVTIPAGETSASFALANTADVGGNAALQFSASLIDGNTTITSGALSILPPMRTISLMQPLAQTKL